MALSGGAAPSQAARRYSWTRCTHILEGRLGAVAELRCFAKSTPPSDTSSHAPLPPARAGPTYPIVLAATGADLAARKSALNTYF